METKPAERDLNYFDSHYAFPVYDFTSFTLIFAGAFLFGCVGMRPMFALHASHATKLCKTHSIE